MSLAAIPLAALLLAQAASGVPPPAAKPKGDPVRPKAPPGLSWEDSDEVARTVARIDRRLRSGRPASRETIVLTERQLNSYVNLALAAKIPPALSGLAVRLDTDRLEARGLVDLDRVKARMPQGAGVLAFLTGSVPVEVRGRFSSAEGEGRVELEEALVSGISLPPAMVAQIVSQSTRTASRPQGFDLLAPFPLPYSARRLRLLPGRALVDFFQ